MQLLTETYGDAGFMSVEADELFMICGGSVNSMSGGASPPSGWVHNTLSSSQVASNISSAATYIGAVAAVSGNVPVATACTVVSFVATYASNIH